jgi:predicted  nucleic acid-binding Zn-ribbon protein
MRLIRWMVPLVLVIAACDTQTKTQLRTLAKADSLRTDSLVSIKNDLLNEVMASTQFVNDLNTEVAKVKSRRSGRLSVTLSRESDMNVVNEERANVVAKIREIVARLDSSEARVATLRARAARLAKHDSTLVGQVAAYERTIQQLRQQVEQQRAEYEVKIASLNSKIDTVTREKTAIADTLNQVNVERNTVYYVIGTKDDLIRNGILVEEGHKRFLILGGRPVAPARDLDTTKFTRIDRLRDRVINFPAGEYTIFSRQNPIYAAPFSSIGGKLSGGLRIDQPEKFWEPSKFLIIVKA